MTEIMLGSYRHGIDAEGSHESLPIETRLRGETTTAACLFSPLVPD